MEASERCPLWEMESIMGPGASAWASGPSQPWAGSCRHSQPEEQTCFLRARAPPSHPPPGQELNNQHLTLDKVDEMISAAPPKSGGQPIRGWVQRGHGIHTTKYWLHS